jgi:hypothetical protein
VQLLSDQTNTIRNEKREEAAARQHQLRHDQIRDRLFNEVMLEFDAAEKKQAQADVRGVCTFTLVDVGDARVLTMLGVDACNSFRSAHKLNVSEDLD